MIRGIAVHCSPPPVFCPGSFDASGLSECAFKTDGGLESDSSSVGPWSNFQVRCNDLQHQRATALRQRMSYLGRERTDRRRWAGLVARLSNGSL